MNSLLLVMVGFLCISSGITLIISLTNLFEKRKLNHEIAKKAEEMGEALEKNAPFINNMLANIFPRETVKK